MENIKNPSKIFQKLNAEFLILSSVVLIGISHWIDVLWFLSFISLVPIFLLLESIKKQKELVTVIFVFSFLYTLTFSFPLLSIESINALLDTTVINSIKFSILIYILLRALVIGISLTVVYLCTKNTLARLLYLPFVFVIHELLLGFLSFSLFWGHIGEALLPQESLRQFAFIGDVFLLTFIVVSFNILVLLIFKHRSHFYKLSSKKRILLILAPALILMMLFITGSIIDGLKNGKISIGSINIAIVQPNFISSPGQQYFDGLHKKTISVLSLYPDKDVDLLLLPGQYFGNVETSELNKKYVELSLLAPFQSRSIVSSLTLDRDSKRYLVTASFNEDGSISISEKESLFPFSDSIPKFIDAIFPKLENFSKRYERGESALLTINTEAGGVNIPALSCSEGFHPFIVRSLLKEERSSRIIIVSGNTGDFGSYLARKAHLRASQLRAISNNSYVLHSMKTGPSAVISPSGKILEKVSRDKEGVIFYNLIL
ncbi:MAG: apolipoprotein N-acyltransferase [Candidatus Pacebacteria bacterium]|jgi:apolipoprotein N-acyltransferase|nr:apolipoprotein N-acyltransferase [bacterium]MDP6527992.1 apolipoprotein N-acyltransferase [Candidatus Paceibacterota bacterium]MDP6659750.1 apolipoprotein N-acyltransferase [Candidatus Paceibacterota bacterium]|tara:strand:+ start:6030 stop:7493 length:1464 start_codon:yes stop_codon:yes gene_type:complete